jgi:hypothetical protein
VSKPEEQPNSTPHAYPSPGRRHAVQAHPSTRSRQRRSRDMCPKRQRLLDPDHEAFVDWFVTYWRQRGARLLAGQTIEKGDA